jgi:hypothetical protein
VIRKSKAFNLRGGVRQFQTTGGDDCSGGDDPQAALVFALRAFKRECGQIALLLSHMKKRLIKPGLIEE